MNTTLILKHTFNASPEKVYATWTDPAKMAKWFGSSKDGAEIHELNVSKGGTYRLTMLGDDGIKYPLSGMYTEVDPPYKLVGTFQWAKNEKIENWANETILTVEFKEVNGKTELTYTHENLYDEKAMQVHADAARAGFIKIEQLITD
ncbi:SRPBCC family protein [Poritiphilus flavus]|uniref:Activator of Hsp90 ATPase homologue 1/2-like C-terminal domain-containing protein n=1 Tax=Poritiphilus flavus TaxID=2697053 RepID=A0A6L9E943_9FLAO|nr:SRPBCC domain-containing protein [Poritiphilus flavus]NAS11154.1 hypothetical protein [Poritiphilus flavus]